MKIIIYYDDDSLDAIRKVNEALKEHNLFIADKTIEGTDFCEFEIEKLK